MTDSPPAFCPAREDLDDLEVLRRGLYGPDATMRPLPAPAEVAAAAVAAGTLVVLDPEGVPVARVLDVTRTGDGCLLGSPTWLAEPSPRPFRRHHLDAPVDLAGADVVLVEAAAHVPSALPDRAHVLVLASTSLDGPSEGNDTVRAAVRSASTCADAWVGVVPLPPGDPARRSALLRTLGLDPTLRPAPHDDAATDGPTERGPRDEAGVVVLLTGLSGSGKSTVARAVATRLVEDGTPVTLLDGDVVRRHLTAGLGFSPADRRTNVLRIGWVAAEVAHHGGIAICSPIAPEDAVRREVARMASDRGARFVLVHVATPLAECERRDRKGLYAAARRGDIADFTGISAPYEEPEHPDLRLDTTGRDVAGCADLVLDLLGGAGRRTDADA
ncbi:adenylyl-sulfate kinase [uncultured Phycicoccus sp.]|uniref:adenylyl-sulfate kinase n=1 Tax=uncultured Phycicoccus sp. TaxID=661422 RepID=UPI0026118494|nr:adenylyl-sulfate kinase [uncultured Phycicoccus sp.]